MEKINESNSSSDLSNCTKDSSSVSGLSKSSYDFYSDGTTDDRNVKDESDVEMHNSEISVPSTSKDFTNKPSEAMSKSTKTTKNYQEKRNEMKQIGIKVEEVKEWIKTKVLIPGIPPKDGPRRYTADYWKTCMRFLYWVNDHSVFENWYHCVICGWTHNVILSGGTKVLKSHADSHVIEKKFEFTREELAQLLAHVNRRVSAADFEKLLPNLDEWRAQSPLEFLNFFGDNFNDTEQSTNGSISNHSKQPDTVSIMKTDTKSLLRAKGDAIRAKAAAMTGHILVEQNANLKQNTITNLGAGDGIEKQNSPKEQTIRGKDDAFTKHSSIIKPMPRSQKEKAYEKLSQKKIKEPCYTNALEYRFETGPTEKLNDSSCTNDTEVVSTNTTNQENKPKKLKRRPNNNTENGSTPVAKRLRRRK